MKMIENCRALRVVPKFCRVLGHKPIGVNKFSSASENPKEQNADLKESLENKPVVKENKEISTKQLLNFKFKFPEFLPSPDVDLRNAVREKLERRDMLRRRNVINIPEFYVGSVLAVTTSDKHATSKQTRFVGICIFREDKGLGTTFILRNVLQHLGVEVQYSLYSPLIQKIEVLRLEKRLDENLLYLRDAPNEYSTFPFDMMKEYSSNDNGVPINTLKVPLNPRPWRARHERKNWKGAIVPEVTEKMKQQAIMRAEPWKKYDLMDEYRSTIPEDEQSDIFLQIYNELENLEKRGKSERRKRIFDKPAKQKVF